VVWSNTDRVAHRVVVERTTCSFTIEPGATGSCTFQNTGRYAYQEPNMRGNAWRGTVTVRAALATVTIEAQPRVVVYGRTITVSGRVSTGAAGERVRIEAMVCGTTAFAAVETVTTTTGGTWTLAVKPLKNTTYRAVWRSATSSGIAVTVRPRVALRKLAGGRYLTHVVAAESFAGRVAVFQRYAPAQRRWVRVRFVTLRQVGGTQPTVVSGATFRARVPAGQRIRVVIGPVQTGPCYGGGASNVVRV